MTKSLTWLKWGVVVGLFLVPFVAFIISTTLYFPFITGKNFAFRIIIDLTFAMYLVLALRDPAYRPRFSWVTVSVLALTGISILATIFSVDPTKSFWSNFERMEGLVGLLHLVVWFFMTSVMLSTAKMWERFLQVSVVASVIMGVYVLLQLTGVFAIDQGGVRTDGTLGNAIYLAVYMLFHIFFTLFLMLRHKGPKWIYALYSVALVLQLIGLYFAATRSATLGLLGGLVLAALGTAFFEKENKTLRRVAVGGLSAIALVVVLFFAVRNAQWVQNNPVLTRFASISVSDGTFQSRLMIWGMASQGVMEHPILGWGQENFNFVFNKYYNPQMWSQEQWFDRAHNAFIDWAVAGGILGFLAFISLFVFAGVAFLRAPGLTVAERSVLVGLVAAYAFHSIFVFDNLMSSVYFFVLLAYAHILTRKELPSAMFLTRPMSDGLFAITAPVSVVVMVVGTYFLNAPGIATASTLIQAMTPQKMVTDATGTHTAQKDPMENLATFKTAVTGSALGRQEAVEQLLQISSQAATNSGVDPAVKEGFVKLATDAGAQLLNMRPGDARLELFYGSFLNLAGNSTEGIKHLVQAHTLSPKKQTIDFELGVNGYLRAGDLVNATTILKEAYDEAPEYPEAAKYYAMALLYAGKVADADSVFTNTFKTLLVDDSRIIGVYGDVKMFDRIIAILKARIEKDANASPETRAQSRASLAEAYKNAGDQSSAAATLRQAIKDLPQFTAQFNQAATQLGLTL